jgi:hypothetical protein
MVVALAVVAGADVVSGAAVVTSPAVVTGAAVVAAPPPPQAATIRTMRAIRARFVFIFPTSTESYGSGQRCGSPGLLEITAK